MFATFVYGLNVITCRKPLMDYFKDCASNVAGAWIQLGNYKVVCQQDKMHHGNPISYYELQDFSEAIECGGFFLQVVSC